MAGPGPALAGAGLALCGFLGGTPKREIATDCARGPIRGRAFRAEPGQGGAGGRPPPRSEERRPPPGRGEAPGGGGRLSVE